LGNWKKILVFPIKILSYGTVTEQEVGCRGMDWLELTLDRDVDGGGGNFECGDKLSVSIHCGKFLD
jgi:hypothetical protein